MDNDVFGTDYCIGFSTAVSRSVEAINALRTTVESHERIGVIELFGRRSGETALLAGFLAQVDRTVIAEVPADLDVLLPLLAEDKASNPAHYAMCVISEGATIAGEERRRATSPSRRASAPTTGVGHRLGRAITTRLGDGVVIQELAYLMRSGEPDAMDRMVGFAFGGLAVQLLERGETARMVTLVRRQLRPRPDRHPAQGHEVGRRQRALRQGGLSRPADAGRGHADVPVLKRRRKRC